MSNFRFCTLLPPKLWRRPALLLAAVVLLGGCAGSSSAAPAAGGGGKGRVLVADKVSFKQIAPFVQLGPAWGDRSMGAHGTFGIFPAGAVTPPHTHSSSYRAVVLSGVMTNPFGSERTPARLGPGSHWYVPAREQHITACVSKEPCLFYMHSKEKFDFFPIKKMTATRSAEAVSAPAAKVNFKQIAPFVRLGAAWGDRSKGPHGTFGIFPGKATSPPHTHSRAYRAVVISGTLVNPFNGEKNPPRMGVGSYWYVPANVDHVTACVSSEPCLFYMHAEGAFDFTPTG